MSQDNFDIRQKDMIIYPREASDVELAKAIRSTLFHLSILEDEMRARDLRFDVEFKAEVKDVLEELDKSELN